MIKQLLHRTIEGSLSTPEFALPEMTDAVELLLRRPTKDRQIKWEGDVEVRIIGQSTVSERVLGGLSEEPWYRLLYTGLGPIRAEIELISGFIKTEFVLSAIR